MLLTKVTIWWYSAGWKCFLQKIRDTFSRIADFFSMNSLIRTLFKPFRQISAETAGTSASLEMKFQMFLDRLVSRFVGFFSRLILLIVGTVIMVLDGVISLVLLLLWPFLPFLPVAGIVLTVMGVVI